MPHWKAKCNKDQLRRESRSFQSMRGCLGLLPIVIVREHRLPSTNFSSGPYQAMRGISIPVGVRRCTVETMPSELSMCQQGVCRGTDNHAG